MITETRQSRSRLLHFDERHHPQRRHHTLDNATLDKFNFICIPLHIEQARIHSSSSQSNLTITPSTNFSISGATVLSSPTRRVRFKFDENDKNQNSNDRHTRSSEDVRLSNNDSIHRVELQIPIHKAINPWLNVDYSAMSSIPAKTRSITSKKIDMNYSNNNMMHLQGSKPFIGTELTSATPSTVDSDKSQTQWYKEMYGRLHKPPETKKGEQQNPYKPTYTFPEEFDGDLELMENYIRKVASEDTDDDYKNVPSSSTRTSTLNTKNQQTMPKLTRFDDQYSSLPISSSTEGVRSSNNPSASSMTTDSRSNTNHIRTPSSTTDDEQKLIYKRILRGGEIPTAGLQRLSVNNRVSSSSTQRPLILTNHPQSPTKLFAYYSVHWEQNQTNPPNNITTSDQHFEINSCLYFQNKNHIATPDDDDDESEQIREDGCGYVITYPSHIRPTDNLQIYNFDRTKNFLLTSNDVYSNSKMDYI